MATTKSPPKKTQFEWTKENPDSSGDKSNNQGFKSLKYRNEIQEIFPMKPLNNTWEDDLKTKYNLVEDTCWDKGFEVWRSLPMRSELEQKLGIGNYPIRRTADFTRKERPEAYLPGFSARKAGPITRPRDSRAPVRVVKLEVKKKPEVKKTAATEGDLPTARQGSGGVLQDGVIRYNQK